MMPIEIKHHFEGYKKEIKRSIIDYRMYEKLSSSMLDKILDEIRVSNTDSRKNNLMRKYDEFQYTSEFADDAIKHLNVLLISIDSAIKLDHVMNIMR